MGRWPPDGENLPDGSGAWVSHYVRREASGEVSAESDITRTVGFKSSLVVVWKTMCKSIKNKTKLEPSMQGKHYADML